MGPEAMTGASKSENLQIRGSKHFFHAVLSNQADKFDLTLKFVAVTKQLLFRRVMLLWRLCFIDIKDFISNNNTYDMQDERIGLR